MNPPKPSPQLHQQPKGPRHRTATGTLPDLAPDDLQSLVSIVLEATPGSARPDIPNGAQLTVRGLERALQQAYRAFKVESSFWAKTKGRTTTTTAVKNELKAVARAAGNLAKQLQTLTPEARWRIGALATDWAWHRPFKGSHTEFMFPRNLMEMGLEDSLKNVREHNEGLDPWDWDGVPVQDVEFLEFHAEGLADQHLEPWWPNQLHGLAMLLERASQSVLRTEAEPTATTQIAGPRELAGLRRKESANGILGGYPVLLLLRELESILDAAAPKPDLLSSLTSPSGVPRIGDLPCAASSDESATDQPHKPTHSTSPLKKLISIMLITSSGQENIQDLLRDPLEKHKAGWVPLHSPDPSLWRSYRTTALLMQDYLTRQDFEDESEPTRFRLQQSLARLEDLVSRAPVQGSKFRMPGSRPLPPGRTILSGVVR